MFSVAVGSSARTVNVQSVWFCSNRRRKLQSVTQLSANPLAFYQSMDASSTTYFSREIRSLLIRSLASVIFVITYCPARYPAPTTPAPIAKALRLRRSQRLDAPIMLEGGCGPLDLCVGVLSHSFRIDRSEFARQMRKRIGDFVDVSPSKHPTNFPRLSRVTSWYGDVHNTYVTITIQP